VAPDKKRVVEMLLEAGADIETKARNGFTTLHIAAFLGWKPVVQELLKRGADPAVETQWFGAEGSNEYEHDMA
jgi:ankyrin repeat protein